MDTIKKKNISSFFKEIIMVIYDSLRKDIKFLDESVSNPSLNNINFGTYYSWVQSVTSQMLINIYIWCWIFTANPMKSKSKYFYLHYVIFFIKYLSISLISSISAASLIYTKIIDISIKTCFSVFFILSVDQSLEIFP